MNESTKKLPLVEMFGPTIQGEGAVIGQQTYFMRFGLCDYKCTMCDSMNAVDPLQVKANARWLTEDEILQAWQEFYKPDTARWITFSGGNPCIHDLSRVVQMLKRYGFRIAVETQGTKSPSWLSMVDIITVSPKGPGMGEVTNLQELDRFMAYVMSANPTAVNMKMVVFDQRDLEFSKIIIERYNRLGVPFYLSLGNMYPPGRIFTYAEGSGLIADEAQATENIVPEYHMTELVKQYRRLFEDISTDPLLSQVRFLPQWHVFVWGNAKGK